MRKGKNILANILANRKYKLSYIVEPTEWAIHWDGKYITHNLNKLGLIKSRVTTTHLFLRNQIIHFGSINTFIKQNSMEIPHWSNKCVLTWFHINFNDHRLKFIKKIISRIEIIHTASSITKDILLSNGVPQERITIIPLGVDLKLFKKISKQGKALLRKAFGLPNNAIIIGSFQKDGVGWSEGLEPKMIKGPDIFVEVLEGLARKYPVFALLTGPARGYVKRKLEEKKIPYKHIYFKDYRQIALLYQVLDIYLITSRVEGGPKQALEAIASGVPVVATKVGMIPDIFDDEKDLLLTNINDVDTLVHKCSMLIENQNLSRQITKKALKSIKKFSWEVIAERYYNEMYKKILYTL